MYYLLIKKKNPANPSRTVQTQEIQNLIAEKVKKYKCYTIEYTIMILCYYGNMTI